MGVLLQRFVVAGVVLGTGFGANPANAAILVTGFSHPQEVTVTSGLLIEDFEDTKLIDNLTINFRGGINPQSYTGFLNQTFEPSTASGLAAPFINNTWDGKSALTNGGHGIGTTGASPGNGNFWDFNFAETTEFSFSKPLQKFGVGLSNFQSRQPSPNIQITNHQLLINGKLWGLTESIAGWKPGTNVRNLYVFIEATENDSIHSVAFRNVSSQDGLVFDHLAISSTPEPSILLGLGSLALAGGTLLRRKRKE